MSTSTPTSTWTWTWTSTWTRTSKATFRFVLFSHLRMFSDGFRSFSDGFRMFSDVVVSFQFLRNDASVKASPQKLREMFRSKIFKRPKNREDGSDFDDFLTIFSKICPKAVQKRPKAVRKRPKTSEKDDME